MSHQASHNLYEEEEEEESKEQGVTSGGNLDNGSGAFSDRETP
jgi:hypothetical protein